MYELKTMKIIKEESIDKVIHAWLRAEWVPQKYDVSHPELKAGLIDNPDFGDIEQNAKRRELLRLRRGQMIDPLPHDIKWYTAEFENSDRSRTYTVPSSDWLPITDGSYRLDVAIANIDSAHDHASRIKDIYEILPSKDIDTKMIMVGSDINSALSIIEGNHRGVALANYLAHHPDSRGEIREVYIGISPKTRDYIWHIESRDAANPGQLRQALRMVNV